MSSFRLKRIRRHHAANTVNLIHTHNKLVNMLTQPKLRKLFDHHPAFPTTKQHIFFLLFCAFITQPCLLDNCPHKVTLSAVSYDPARFEPRMSVSSSLTFVSLTFVKFAFAPSPGEAVSSRHNCVQKPFGGLSPQSNPLMLIVKQGGFGFYF